MDYQNHQSRSFAAYLLHMSTQRALSSLESQPPPPSLFYSMSNSEALIDLNNPELWRSDEAFLTVWNTLHPWFEKQGYILYPRDPMNPDLAVPGSEDVYTHEKRCSGYPFVPTLHGEEHNRSFSVLVSTLHNQVVTKSVNDKHSLS